MLIGGLAIGPLISFEATFSDLPRQEVQRGAQLLVYQSSTSTFQGTWAQPQLASQAAVHAAEVGHPAVHTGLSASALPSTPGAGNLPGTRHRARRDRGRCPARIPHHRVPTARELGIGVGVFDPRRRHRRSNPAVSALTSAGCSFGVSSRNGMDDRYVGL